MKAMSSVQYQNKKVVEPAIDLDNTVPTPELNDDTIYSSNLTFINISEGLHKLIDQKIQVAQQRHIDQMRQKNHEVQAHKSLLRALEEDGLSVIPAIDADRTYDNVDFKSCGDLDKDLRSIEEKTFKAQTQLLALDEKYYPVHMEIKVFSSAFLYELTPYFQCVSDCTLSTKSLRDYKQQSTNWMTLRIITKSSYLNSVEYSNESGNTLKITEPLKIAQMKPFKPPNHNKQ